MANNFGAVNSGKCVTPNADYPYGAPRDITTPDDNTGTAWKAANLIDWVAFVQAILTRAAVTPNGTPDTALNNQILDALITVAGGAQSVLYPISSGTTTTVYGIPKCSAFSVAFPGTLVDGAVYRFIPHATNNEAGATTINGKALKSVAIDGTTELDANYKALRPGRVAEVMYRDATDDFVCLNPTESYIMHVSLVTATSGSLLPATHGMTFTRTATGIYQVSVPVGANCHVIAQSETAGVLASASAGGGGTFNVYTRDYAGTLVNTVAQIRILVIF